MSRLFPRAHAQLPALAQDLVLTAHRRRARRRRLGPDFEARLDALLASARRSPAEVEESLRRELPRMAGHAAEHCPFWRRRLAEAGLDPAALEDPAALSVLPVLDRDEARRAGDGLRSRAFSRRRLETLWTSGTTGAPLRVRLTTEALRRQWAIWWRHRVEHGVRPGARSLTCGARLPPLGRAGDARTWRRDLATGDAYLSVHELTRERLDALVRWLRGERFELLAGYPSSLAVVARALRERGERLGSPPALVACGSETLDGATESLLAESFEAPVTDHYGLTECCGNFSRCAEGSYHADPELGFAELLPIDGAADPRLGRLVFTGLANLAMPLLRYAPGDLAVEREGPCPCGRPGLALARIEGRAEELLATPDGRRVGGLNQALKWARGAEAVQVRQESPAAVRALVVAGEGWSEKSGERLLQELRARLGPEVELSLERVASIPLSASGKRSAVVVEPGARPRDGERGP